MARIDLHLHTTYSDGSLSPRDVVGLAHQADVRVLAITDHDIVDGLPEALEAGRHTGIEVIPGVEISSRFLEKETHILGYFVNWERPSFRMRLSHFRTTRHSRNLLILRKLNDLGLDLSYEEVKTVAGSDSVGRPHIALVLTNKGYVKTVEEAFARYLGNGAAAYIPRELPDSVEVIALIREMGGIPVLAHPSWVKPKGEGIQKICEQLKEGGLMGIEVFYSTHNPKQTSEYLEIARRLDLLITGGSDFHGLTKPGIEVGVGKGDLNVPEKLLEPLRKAALS